MQNTYCNQIHQYDHNSSCVHHTSSPAGCRADWNSATQSGGSRSHPDICKIKTCRLMSSRSPSWNWDHEALKSQVRSCLFQIRARFGWCLASETKKCITLVWKKLSAMKVNKSGIVYTNSKYTYFLNVLFTIFHYHTDIHHHTMVYVTMHGC
jgi:hypothetical protein